MNRKCEYKPLLFTTTLRNPSRMKDFLRIISEFDGQVLSNEIILQICGRLIENKIYITTYQRQNAILNNIALNESFQYSKKQILDIISHSIQRHKEADFDSGWPSRFDTWYKFFKELGFIYYKMDEPIKISDTGKLLLKANEEGCYELESQAFLNAFVKYQRNNPYRRVKNLNKPFILLLRTILKIKELENNKDIGIYAFEIPYFLSWKDDNFDELANYIILNRKLHGLKPSDEIVYENCKNILNLSDANEKRFKISNILHEMPDDFIRKMRLTGVFSLRGMGRYLDINSQFSRKIEYIVLNYSECLNFSDELKYFDFMSKVDSNLVDARQIKELPESQYITLFNNLVKQFEIETLKKEILLLTQKNGKSSHDLFRYIDAPTRLEFLTALLLKKTFKDLLVIPNYPIDDEGIPTSTAGGNAPDIYCKEGNMSILIEVTMLSSTQQNVRETPPVTAHLKKEMDKNNNSFTLFIAPIIHEQTTIFMNLTCLSYNISIITNTIKDFVLKIQNIEHLSQIKKIKK